MANLRDIRRRIKSVKNTAQITKAMQMVAASKMKKAQDQALSGRAYADLMNKVLVNLKSLVDEDAHPLLEERSGDRELVLLITPDKGLCGALNTNLVRAVVEQASPDAQFITVGRKGSQSLSRLNRALIADFGVADPVQSVETRLVSKFIIEKFLDGEFDQVKVGFTNFVNTVSQIPVFETLLPVCPISLGRDKDWAGVGDEGEEKSEEEQSGGDYIFEPNAEHVLDVVVPQYVNNQVYQMVLESRASEHSARMVAMKNATDNAEQMIKDLTLDYNKQRQAAITAELLEITTAMKAIE